MPVVSFNIVTYNRAELLKKCLNSIVVQSFKDFEVVVIDDASTDHTPSVIQSFGHLSIKYYRNDTQMGISYSRNRAVSLSEGELIAVLDSDDECLPERLFRSVEVMKKLESVEIVFGNALLQGNKDKYEVYECQKESAKVFADLFFINPIIHSTVLVKRRLLLQYFYLTEFDGCEDYELWTRMIKPDNFYWIDREISIYNIHSESISFSKFEDVQHKYFKIVLVHLCNQLSFPIPEFVKNSEGFYHPKEMINTVRDIISQIDVLKNRYPSINIESIRSQSEIFFKKYKKYICIRFFYQNKNPKKVKYYFICFSELIDSLGFYSTFKLLIRLLVNKVSVLKSC